MRIYPPDRLKEVLRLHDLWLRNEMAGSRANLRGANLIGDSLIDANLCGADLMGADLIGANLIGANLIDANLRGASLRGADLRDANLRDANLRGADLRGATGNMREVKSAQFNIWPIAWTRSPDGVATLRIGCQSHDLEKWRTADPQWIAAMDPGATEWWTKYGAIVLALVDAAPAVPWKNQAEPC
jgi:uncharacterized protein YjbI with pentapeptide repeats